LLYQLLPRPHTVHDISSKLPPPRLEYTTPVDILLAPKNNADRYSIPLDYYIITITTRWIITYHVKQPHFQLCSKCAIRMLKIPSSGTSLISLSICHALFSKCSNHPHPFPHITFHPSSPFLSSSTLPMTPCTRSPHHSHYPPSIVIFTSISLPSCPSSKQTRVEIQHSKPTKQWNPEEWGKRYSKTTKTK
jgi:hypothetical protein